jgi:hypothetical protein
MSKWHQRYCFSPLRQVLTSLNFIVAMIGCRSMGGGLALLFAEHGVSVSLHDPSSVVMDGVIESAKQQNIDPVPSKHWIPSLSVQALARRKSSFQSSPWQNR